MHSDPRRYHQSFPVPFTYPIHFTRDLFSGGNPILQGLIGPHTRTRPQKIFICIDDGVARHHPGLAEQVAAHISGGITNTAVASEPLVLTGGEETKDGWANVLTLIHHLAEKRIDRHNFVLAIGGGAFLDMAGFAAALVHRGLRFIRVPTTTLAQNDAGIGVKNGINAEGQKNYLGTFSPPFAVINDSAFLETLDFTQWIGGVSEAFKVAIIKDRAFFSFLIRNAPNLRNRDLAIMEETIYRCALLHLDHIRTSGDPFEFGSARPLDFGHWAAHKLESMSAYQLGHGQAVAVGIAIDSYIATRRGLLSEHDFDSILTGLEGCGLPVYTPLLEGRAPSGRLTVCEGLDQFREHLGGILTITLPDGIGAKVEVHEVENALIEEAVGFLARAAKKGRPAPGCPN